MSFHGGRRTLRPEVVVAMRVFLVGLPANVNVAELTVRPAGLQALGRPS